MKNSTKHLIFQAMVVSLILVGCSSVDTTQERTVRDFVMEVVNNVDMAKEPSMVLVGYPSVNSSDRSNSIWMSCMTVKEPAVEILDIESMMKSQLNEHVTSKSEGPKVASQRHQTILVGDALNEVLSDSDTIEEPTIKKYIVKVTANDTAEELKMRDFIVEVTTTDYIAKFSPTK